LPFTAGAVMVKLVLIGDPPVPLNVVSVTLGVE
jgi:hypothetical protein